ncbi:hypothetical protein LM599_00925 [Candidatus Acetothermia bacterium]|nr:hypothetical protein [Candidatus Acetothermia bacterium]MCI2427430.1 hypothetical protein [Candidatus Acetothermia bacterium]MCI2428501.1 hypothetical protein [Candidatus Acetothermia bacterium]
MNVVEFHKAKQVVIVTEASILDDVITTVTKLGAVGYTIQNATGKAHRWGARLGNYPGGLFDNVRIDVITISEELAKTIAVEIMKQFFKNHAGIVYLLDVEIIRKEKFAAGHEGSSCCYT